MSEMRKMLSASSWLTWLAAIAAVLVLYLVSVGPLEWLDVLGALSDSARGAVSVYCKPIRWLCGESELGLRAVSWYVDLWVEYPTFKSHKIYR